MDHRAYLPFNLDAGPPPLEAIFEDNEPFLGVFAKSVLLPVQCIVHAIDMYELSNMFVRLQLHI